jgi:phospholipid/cholesterol/gamma-HCH transport system substrate-binding protein
VINESTGKIVELQIKSNFPISKSSVAAIYEPGFIAGKQISIEPNFKDKSIAIEGDTLRGEDWDLLKGSGEISSSSRKIR